MNPKALYPVEAYDITSRDHRWVIRQTPLHTVPRLPCPPPGTMKQRSTPPSRKYLRSYVNSVINSESIWSLLPGYIQSLVLCSIFSLQVPPEDSHTKWGVGRRDTQWLGAGDTRPRVQHPTNRIERGGRFNCLLFRDGRYSHAVSTGVQTTGRATPMLLFQTAHTGGGRTENTRSWLTLKMKREGPGGGTTRR